MLEPSVYQQPGFMAVTGPIHTWAVLVSTRRVPLSVLKDAWQIQTMRVLKAKDPWKVIEGPAGVLAVQLRRIHWCASSAHMWKTRSGTVLDLREVSPVWVRELARKDLERIKWEEWAQITEQAPEMLDGIVPRAPAGYWLDPIRALFASSAERARWQLTPLALACLRSTMIGGQWSQQRLYLYK